MKCNFSIKLNFYFLGNSTINIYSIKYLYIVYCTGMMRLITYPWHVSLNAGPICSIRVESIHLVQTAGQPSQNQSLYLGQRTFPVVNLDNDHTKSKLWSSKFHSKFHSKFRLVATRCLANILNQIQRGTKL